MPREAPSLLRRTAHALISVEWLLLALLLPAILVVNSQTLPLLLLVPFLWGVRRVAHGRFLPRTPLNATLLLLLILILVNVWATVDFTLSLPHVAGALYGIALFFAIVAFGVRGRREFHGALVVYIGLGLALAVAALFTTEWPAKFPVISAVVARLPSVANAINPNYLAGALLWLAPLPLALLGALPGNLRALRRSTGALQAAILVLATAGSAAILLTVLLLTQSRSGLVGLAAAVAFITVILLRRHRRLLLFGLILAIIMAGIVYAAVPAAFWIQFAGISDGASLSEPATVGLDSRVEIWRRAQYMIEDFPLTGAGMGTFDHVVRLLYPIYMAGSDSAINHAHNHLLQAAVDLGIPGLVVYLALWVGAATMLLAAWRGAHGAWHHALVLGFAAALFAYFVYGLTEAIPLGGRPGFIFWYLLALVATLHYHTTQPSPKADAI